MGKQKQETFEKREKRHEAESRELAKLKRENARADGRGYMFALMAVLTIIYVIDELASNMNSAMQPYAILDFFNIPNILDDAYAPTLGSITAIITVPTALILLIGPFYKALADKYGRKLFLGLNTIIMGFGLFVAMVAPNIAGYVIGIVIVTFVQSNDMQVMYVMETAPAKHRAKLCSITKAIALVGVSLIGVFRTMFYDPAVPSSWRYVFLIPAVLGMGVGLLCFPFIRETPVFRKKRMEYLELTDEEREAQRIREEQAKSATSHNGGVRSALKYIFRTPQLRYATLAGLIFCLSTGITGYYSTILEAAQQVGKLTKEQVDAVIILFPFVNGVITLICGFVSDALGRKKACLTITSFAVVGLAGFFISTSLGLSAVVIGCFYGLFIGCLWSVSDTIILVIPSESTPTEMRASVVGTLSLFSNIAMLLAIVMVIVGMNIVGTAGLGIFCLCTAVPCLVIAILLLLIKVRETAGEDLNSPK